MYNKRLLETNLCNVYIVINLINHFPEVRVAKRRWRQHKQMMIDCVNWDDDVIAISKSAMMVSLMEAGRSKHKLGYGDQYNIELIEFLYCKEVAPVCFSPCIQYIDPSKRDDNLIGLWRFHYSYLWYLSRKLILIDRSNRVWLFKTPKNNNHKYPAIINQQNDLDWIF